ncbi:hypothetical protein EJB05_27617, partial [Eragrostis curvula]
MEAKKPYVIAIVVQMIYAGLLVVSKAAFNHGMNTFVFTFYRQAASSLLLLPIAILLERNTFTLNVVSASMKFTSATVASAAYNGVPEGGCEAEEPLRHSKAHWGSVLSRGSLRYRLLYRACVEPCQPSSRLCHSCCNYSRAHGMDQRDIPHGPCRIGIVPAGLLEEYPNKMLVTLSQCVFSTVQSFVVAMVVERDFSEWKLRPDISLLAILYSGFVVNGVSYYLQAWCVELKGPVFLTIWNPLCLVFTIFCSTFFLGEIVHMGSIVGGLLLVGGLYSVLWGKNKEKKVALCNEAGRTEDEQNHIHAEEGKGDMEAAVEEELSKCSKGS